VPFPWSTLLAGMTDPANAYAVPYTLDIFSTSGIQSYLGPVKNNILKSANSNYSLFGYPLNGETPVGINKPVIKASVLIGFQFQIIQNAYNQNQTNYQSLDDYVISVQGQQFQFSHIGRPLGDIAPDTIIWENVIQVISDSEELLSAANLQSQTSTIRNQVDIPNNLLVAGNKYTIRARGILTCPDVVTNFGNQWYLYQESRPFYTGWSSTIFNVNAPPTVTNLATNGDINPTKVPNGPVYLTFLMVDPDGPSFGYDLQVSSVQPPQLFQANVWDTNLVADSQGTGTRSYSIPYAGPRLLEGTTYYWRVKGNDSLTEGSWSQIASFKINIKPRISSLKVNGNELTTGDVPYVSNQTPVITWVFSDGDSDEQKGYILTYSYDKGNTITFSSVGQGTTITLPTLPNGKQVDITLKAKDDVEETNLVTGSFLTNANPLVTNFRINGLINPVNLTSLTPTFSWTFQDIDIGDSQQKYRIKVSKNIEFTSLAWDTGEITSSSISVVYGSTPSPVVAPEGLLHSHGTYYVRVYLYDGVSWSIDGTNNFAYFAINTIPGTPLLTYPTTGAYSGTMNVQWAPATPPDLDGDPVTYTLEITKSRLSNKGWEYLAGPFAQSQNNYLWDLSDIPSGDNYGIRVTSSDGVSESPASASDRFSILNHAPNMPVLVFPETSSVVNNKLRVGWIEANPKDVDEDMIFYILELSSNASATSPTWTLIGNYTEGTTTAIFDVSALADGTDYKVRLRTIDEHGAEATPVYSGLFSIYNQVVATDFERNSGVLYLGTSDGRVYRAKEDIWQYFEDWSGEAKSPPLEVYMTSGSSLTKENGELKIVTDNSTCILRHKKLGDQI